MSSRFLRIDRLRIGLFLILLGMFDVWGGGIRFGERGVCYKRRIGKGVSGSFFRV